MTTGNAPLHASLAEPLGAMPETVVDVLRRGMTETPDADALVGRFSRLSYSQLEAEVQGATRALFHLGVRPGDRVGASLANHPDLVVAFLGVLRLGAIWVGINRTLALPEMEYILDDAGIGVFLAEPPLVAAVEQEFGSRRDLRSLVCLMPADKTDEWRSLFTSAETAHDRWTPEPASPAAIAYTSGTTGRPKGVVHSHHNLLLPGAVRAADPRPGDDRMGVCLPLTILNLMILGPLTAFQSGAASVIVDRMDVPGLVQWVAREAITSLAVPPTTLYDLLSSPEVGSEGLGSLMYPGTGGAFLPDGLSERFSARYGSQVIMTYGLTEAPTAVTMTDPATPRREGSSGRPLPHVEIVICDDKGGCLPPGEVGEICIAPASRGRWAGLYTPMLGYWGRPEESTDTVRDGLLWTGDLGYLSPDGELFVTARKSDLIVRGGANVYPAEVERVLDAHPSVSSSTVIGLPDDRLGERVVAAVELAPGEATTVDELLDVCRRSLARYKVPDRVLVLPTLPRNAMGKVVRERVRERFFCDEPPFQPTDTRVRERSFPPGG